MAKKSRALTASASGFYCTSNLCDSDDDEAVTIAPTKFNSESKILEVMEPTFLTASLYQSTSIPDATATVTVSLKTNKAIRTDDKKITLTGLCGTVVNADSIALLDMFGSTLHTYSSPSTNNIAEIGRAHV